MRNGNRLYRRSASRAHCPNYGQSVQFLLVSRSTSRRGPNCKQAMFGPFRYALCCTRRSYPQKRTMRSSLHVAKDACSRVADRHGGRAAGIIDIRVTERSTCRSTASLTGVPTDRIKWLGASFTGNPRGANTRFSRQIRGDRLFHDGRCDLGNTVGFRCGCRNRRAPLRLRFNLVWSGLGA